ncbi:hypothetical protein [Bdellovibrio svalbardensis]|uniref:Uncharacterized protein n=1 Tax=Bdellovibrio svalbardensis TaxID=2972972 RepID=A0ABT6DHZ1_9BACT|nr:hypothetical protein [Bdellovibrio svalbardensis]MDG0816465.1 hypothetical protein [Bdellovibrio svalbardensis]
MALVALLVGYLSLRTYNIYECLEYKHMVVCGPPAKVALGVVLVASFAIAILLILTQLKIIKFPEGPDVTDFQKKIEERVNNLTKKHNLSIDDRWRKYRYHFLFLKLDGCSIWIFDNGNIDFECDSEKQKIIAEKFESEQALADYFQTVLENYLNRKAKES